MAGKIYWLKMPKDFTRKRHVRYMTRKGVSVAWAYLQILLETLETEGIFEYHPDIFDSLADEIADVIDSDIETVETMIDILGKFGLIDIGENVCGFKEILGWVGSETKGAERKRRYDERLGQKNALQSNGDALQSNGDVSPCNTEKEKENKEEEKEREKERQINTESEWSVFLGIISDVIPESKLRNPEKCRELLETRIEETGLTAEELGNCLKDYFTDFTAGSDLQFFKQLERILGDAYRETLKSYVTKKAKEKKKAQQEEEEEHINLWDDDDSEDSIDFSAKLGEPWQSFKKVIDRGLIPETNVDLVLCTELLEKRCNAGYKAELLATCINEHAEACRKCKLQIKPLAEILGGNLFNGTIVPMYRKKYGQLVTIPADSGNREEEELPF